VKRTLAFVSALLVTTPAMANKGHVIQVHHGSDCVEFVLLEDALTVCGADNVFLSNGTVNGTCLANVPWYGIATGQGSGQTALMVAQLPFFIAGTSAIDTAFHEWQGVNGAVDVQTGEGFPFSTISTEYTLLFGPSSAIGFTPGASFSCKNIDAATGTHTVTSIGNINTPPGPFQ
jgi:hypothetical protein